MTYYTKLLIGLLVVLSLYSCEYNDVAVKKSPTPSSPSPSTPPPSPPLPECGNLVITGYTNKVSYFPGEELEFFLQSETAHSFDCGLGFYDVNGNLIFRSATVLLHQTIYSDEPWKYGFHFSSNGKIILPPSLASGIYSIENKISFVVKSSIRADITVVYPSNTINAYNPAGGKSLYGFNSSESEASAVVSFLRPMDSPSEKDECIECLKWFPTLTDIKINYVADIDLNDYSSFQGKVVAIIGHSEYWTRKARRNFDHFVDAGGHAMILSGNTMWWHIRYTAKNDALICYREPYLDPELNEDMKTVRWNEQILQYPIVSSIGADFDNGGYGLHLDKGWDGYKIFNPASPLLEGLSFSKGDILKLPSGECDGAPIKAWDADGFPILDSDKLGFARLELIGFDRGSRGTKETIPTFIVMQKHHSSGVIVNVGSINWCSPNGMGSQASGDKIKIITKNTIDKLLTGENVFSD